MFETTYQGYRICEYSVLRPSRAGEYCSKCDVDICMKFKSLGLDKTGKPLPYLERPRCDAVTRKCFSCRNRVVPGKKRCRLHGGLSTGPKADEGKARIAEVQRKRWAAFRKSKSGVD